jgi:predicted ester cyclase
MGIAPTRRTVKVTGLTLFRIHGNRIAEAWSNWDTLGMLQQLGVVPASINSST